MKQNVHGMIQYCSEKCICCGRIVYSLHDHFTLVAIGISSTLPRRSIPKSPTKEPRSAPTGTQGGNGNKTKIPGSKVGSHSSPRPGQKGSAPRPSNLTPGSPAKCRHPKSPTMSSKGRQLRQHGAWLISLLSSLWSRLTHPACELPPVSLECYLMLFTMTCVWFDIEIHFIAYKIGLENKILAKPCF